jgi:hypothetical protein
MDPGTIYRSADREKLERAQAAAAHENPCRR